MKGASKMEIPGFTPRRRVRRTSQGYTVYVKPPQAVGEYPEVSVFLTPDQYQRYMRWRTDGVLIQVALPDLSISEREMLMTGLGDKDFHNMTRDDD
jgi:hypothetical protein